MNEKSKENLAAKGLTITEITPEEKDGMRAKLKSIADNDVEDVGEDLSEMMAAISKSVRHSGREPNGSST